MGFIDCDSHVAENETTWDYFDPTERQYRPVIVRGSMAPLKPAEPGQPPAGGLFADLWLVNDAWVGVFPPDSVVRDNGNRYDPATTQLSEPALRIKELDALGIDVQLLQTTMFLAVEVENPMAEAAIKRSWNRWMADRAGDSGGRLVWTAEVPTRMLDRALEEVEFAKANGAVGVHFHGIEHGCYLDDPYFRPLLARMQDLDLTVVSHIGRPMSQSAGTFPIGRQFPTFASFMEHMNSPMTIAWTVLMSDIHQRFPRLRFCFNEIGASWVHYMEYQFRRILASTKDFKVQPIDAGLFEERNIFISCFADEDLPALTAVLGENVLTCGTDYAHNDSSSQLVGHSTILGRGDVDGGLAKRIVDINGRKAFAIDPAFRPTDGLVEPDSMPATRAVKTELAGKLDVVGISA